MFSKKTKYVSTSAWRGYVQPIFAVIGWNDTGMFSDSPCKTSTGLKESKLAKKFLKQNNIPFRTMTCQTSNVFCVSHFLIVPEEMFERAKKLLSDWYPTIKDETRLIYLAY